MPWSRRKVLAGAGVLTVASAATVWAATRPGGQPDLSLPAAPDSKPYNILLVTSDQEQAWSLLPAGFIERHCPGRARLLRESLSFSRAYTPSPVCATARAALDMAQDGRLWTATLDSLTVYASGLGLAIIAGITAGPLMGGFRLLGQTLELYVMALAATPRVAFIPLIIVLLGLGFEAKVAIIFLGAVMPVVLNTYAGVMNADGELVEHENVESSVYARTLAVDQAPDELAAHKAAVDDRDHDMPFCRASVAIDHHDVVIVDARLDHAVAADPEHEARRPIEPQQLDQVYRVILPILGRAWKAGAGCA